MSQVLRYEAALTASNRRFVGLLVPAVATDNRILVRHIVEDKDDVPFRRKREEQRKANNPNNRKSFAGRSKGKGHNHQANAGRQPVQKSHGRALGAQSSKRWLPAAFKGHLNIAGTKLGSLTKSLPEEYKVGTWNAKVDDGHRLWYM